MTDNPHLALWIAAAVMVLIGLIGLALFLGGWRRFFHGKFANGLARVLVGLVLLLGVVLVAAAALNLRTYLRLTYEQPVASIRFSARGPQDFRAVLTDAHGNVTTVELRGDDWELSARVLKWKGLANLLGLDALYHLDRLEGRYRSTEQERHDYHSVVDLSAGGGLDFWRFARHNPWLPWVDADYGSGVYLPMADGAEYQVSLSVTGLVARPGNTAAQQAEAQLVGIFRTPFPRLRRPIPATVACRISTRNSGVPGDPAHLFICQNTSSPRRSPHTRNV